MPGRQSTGPPVVHNAKPRKSKKKRSLSALSIAEKIIPAGRGTRHSRLGELDERRPAKRAHEQEEDDDSRAEAPKRRKRDDINPTDENVEVGSDSSGNEWMTGQVDEDDDSELDSDEAMGDSDEDRFEGFAFHGSSSHNSHQKKGKGPSQQHSRVDGDEVNLSEDDQEGLSDEDDFGEGGVDLADVLDDHEDDDRLSGSPGAETLNDPATLLGEDDGVEDMQSEKESQLSFSDDDPDSRNPQKLATLRDMFTSLKNSRSEPGQGEGADPREAMPPSEFGIKSKRKLTLADLEATVKDPGLRRSLKYLQDDNNSSSKRRGVPKKLAVPLPKRQQDSIDRAAAYEKSKETLSRWVDTVKHNRRAEHLSFPLPDPDGVIPQGQNRLLPNTNSKPVTDIETTIQAIMQESGLMGQNGKPEEDQIRAFEELKTMHMPYSDVVARQAELRRRRDLLFREEARAKRIKKIKSKQYRKIHRKERERNISRVRDALAADGEVDSESEKERNDRRRAEERMGAKHRESKWAKGMKASGRTKWDEDAREGVLAMARRGDELKRRMAGRTPHEEDDDRESSESDDNDGDQPNGMPIPNRLQGILHSSKDDNEATSEPSGLADLAFMRKAEAARREKNDNDAESLRRGMAGENASTSEEDGSEGAGRRNFGPTKNKRHAIAVSDTNVQKSEFEEGALSDDEISGKKRRKDIEMDRVLVDTGHTKPSTSAPSTTESLPKVTTVEGSWNTASPEPSVRVGHSNNRSSSQSKDSGQLRSALKGSRAAEKGLKNGNVQHVEPSSSNQVDDQDEANPDLEAEPIIMSNAELARRAFAGDDVLDKNFRVEKAELMKEQGDQIIDETLPGWGAWTGTGLSKQDKKPQVRRIRRVQGVAPESRKDAKLKDVIISEKNVKKNGKYLASQLPHPFETKAQYERSLRLPVGPEWTTKETFQGMTKPRILMKQGVIAPMAKPMV